MSRYKNRPQVFKDIKTVYRGWFADPKKRKYFKLIHFILSYSFPEISLGNHQVEPDGRYKLNISKKDFYHWFSKHPKKLRKDLKELSHLFSGISYTINDKNIEFVMKPNAFNILLNTQKGGYSKNMEKGYLLILNNEYKLTNNQLYLLKILQPATNRWNIYSIDNIIKENVYINQHYKKTKQKIIDALKSMQKNGTIDIELLKNDKQVKIKFVKLKGANIGRRIRKYGKI